jgi:hypothetical protein
MLVEVCRVGAVFRRARIRTLVVTLSAAVLVSGVGVPDDLLVPVVAAAIADPPEPESIEGSQLKREAPAKGAEDSADAPKATRPAWPSAGRAEATLAERPAQVGDLPVRLGKAAGNAGGVAPGSDSARVSVEALPQDSVKKLGGTGLAVRIARVDGASQPVRAQVTLDYSAFRYAHGGGWADRLRVVRLPACALTSAADCDRSGEIVPAVNDVKAGTLTRPVQALAAIIYTSKQPSYGTKR